MMPTEEIIDKYCHDHSYVIRMLQMIGPWWAPNSGSSNLDAPHFAK